MGHFYAIGGSDQAKIWSSQDGHTWTEYNPHTGWLADCANGNDMVFVAGGFHWIHQTSDNQSWYEGGDFGGHLRTVTFGNGLFIAAGDEQVAISHDGTCWTRSMITTAIKSTIFIWKQSICCCWGQWICSDICRQWCQLDPLYHWCRQYRIGHLSQWHVLYRRWHRDLSIQ